MGDAPPALSYVRLLTTPLAAISMGKSGSQAHRGCAFGRMGAARALRYRAPRLRSHEETVMNQAMSSLAVTCLSIFVLVGSCFGGAPLPTATAIADTPNLTGTYLSDYNGIYYVQQSGNNVWWVGFSLVDPTNPADHLLPADQIFHRGLYATNFFRGTIPSSQIGPFRAHSEFGSKRISRCLYAMAPNCINGNWVGVSRGTTLSSGAMTLQFDASAGVAGRGYILTVVSHSGMFRTTHLTPTAPISDMPDMYARFSQVEKGPESCSLHCNGLKPFRDQTVFYGRVLANHINGGVKEEPPHFDDSDVPKTYHDFICDKGEDHDIDFNMAVDRSRVESHFRQAGWDDRNANDVLQKLYDNTAQRPGRLTANESYLHPEVIMYGHTAKCSSSATNQTLGRVLFPGWGDVGGNSLLVNGRPVNGNLKELYGYNVNTKTYYQEGIRFGNQSMVPGDQIRLTGSLILDCGHWDWDTLNDSCHEGNTYSDDNDAQNQEVHPVYSIDIIRPPLGPGARQARQNLTGAWGTDSGGTLYIRQIGNTVWWLGLERDRQPLVPPGSSPQMQNFATVFKGTITRNPDGSETIKGDGDTLPEATLTGGLTYTATFRVAVDRKEMTLTTRCHTSNCPTDIAPIYSTKLYEPEDTTVPKSTLSIGRPQWFCSAFGAHCGSSQPLAVAQVGTDVQVRGNELWVSHATPFTVNATDMGSGAQNIWYRFYPRGSATPPAYTPVTGSSATFTLTGADGWYEVDTFATDNAGNDEASHSTFVYLDNSGPAVTITQPTGTAYAHSTTLSLAYTVSDGAGAGPATQTATMDGSKTLAGHGLSAGQPVNLLTEIKLGRHAFRVDAVDHLGNPSTQSIGFTIIVTPQSIIKDVNQFVASKALVQDEATVLIGKLQEAANARGAGNCKNATTAYRSFVHEVQIQSGKKVGAAAASILIGDANYLIAHCP